MIADPLELEPLVFLNQYDGRRTDDVGTCKCGGRVFLMFKPLELAHAEPSCEPFKAFESDPSMANAVEFLARNIPVEP